MSSHAQKKDKEKKQRKTIEIDLKRNG